MRVVLITNQPTPYRTPVFELAARQDDIDLHVLYCSSKEPDREWDPLALVGGATVLRGRALKLRGRFIHWNLAVFGALRESQPDVVITTGFNPTHLMAFAWTMLSNRKHIVMTDGTLRSEATLSWLHRLVRRLVFKQSSGFVCAATGGLDLYATYGIDPRKCFKSCLAVDNDRFVLASSNPRVYDVAFSGRLVPVKNPLFALRVAATAAARLGRRLRMAIFGSGPLLDEMSRLADELADQLDVHFFGFLKQADLPAAYGQCKVLLVPSAWEPWGLVVNEATAAGLNVLASEHVGAAEELVSDGINGFRINQLSLEVWAGKLVEILDRKNFPVPNLFGQKAVRSFTFERAASGLVEACRHAMRPRGKRVVIVQRRIPHYRVEFFDLLRDKLLAKGVELHVVAGGATEVEESRKDGGRLSWASSVSQRSIGSHLYMLRFKGELRDADLVVFPHEARLINIHSAFFLKSKRRKLAFWGHGQNFQNPNRVAEHLKAVEARKADHFFAYTALSAEYLRGIGVDPRRITVLNNSVSVSVVPDVQPARGCRAAYVGTLYAEKRIEVLLRVAGRLAVAIDGFELHVIGAGPDEGLVRTMAESSSWLKWHGAVTGDSKQEILECCHVHLCPGMVGVNIVDAFAAALPTITMDHGVHSPEVVYLETNVNGLIVPDCEEEFFVGVLSLLTDPGRLYRMRSEALASARRYTVGKMADNFADGILNCLAR